jgi:hypothetical protein
MRGLKSAQLKALSDFANTVAAAWFTAGVISPFFTKPASLLEVFRFLLIGLLMTWITLTWSLSLVKEVKL